MPRLRLPARIRAGSYAISLARSGLSLVRMSDRAPTRKQIGVRLAIARKRAKAGSREVIGRRLGVTGETVRKWEIGRTMPDAVELARLARIYDVPCSYLLALSPLPEVEIRPGKEASGRIIQLADEILRLAVTDATGKPSEAVDEPHDRTEDSAGG